MYKLEVNPVLEFIITNYIDNSYVIRDDDEAILDYDLSHIEIDNKTFSEIYGEYSLWCLDNNKPAKNTNNFSKAFKNIVDPYYEVKKTTKYENGARVNVKYYLKRGSH